LVDSWTLAAKWPDFEFGALVIPAVTTLTEKKELSRDAFGNFGCHVSR
jgi:hypothetical protein